ncbi:hypothetical protein GGI21_003833, partial [Coemansia aciculifera]
MFNAVYSFSTLLLVCSSLFFSAEALVGFPPRACAAQNILNTCLSVQGLMFNTCAYSDWSCKCAAQRTIASCFNNCPDDGGRAAQDGQVTVYCNAAMRVEEEKSASQSQAAAKTSTAAAPKTAKAVPSAVGTGATNGNVEASVAQPALAATQSLGKVDRAIKGSSATAAVDNSATLRGVSKLAVVVASGIGLMML